MLIIKPISEDSLTEQQEYDNISKNIINLLIKQIYGIIQHKNYYFSLDFLDQLNIII